MAAPFSFHITVFDIDVGRTMEQMAEKCHVDIENELHELKTYLDDVQTKITPPRKVLLPERSVFVCSLARDLMPNAKTKQQ